MSARRPHLAGATLLVALASPLPSLVAQRPATPAAGRTLQATTTLRIETPRLELRRIRTLSVGPRGEIVIVGGAQYPFQSVRALDATGTRAIWTLSTRGDEAELRRPSRLGWHGSTLWAADPGFDHVALIAPDGRVTRSIEEPSWFRPSSTLRRTFPTFATGEILAYRPDRGFLVQPGDPRSLLGARDYDASVDYIVRTNEDGIIQNVVARIARPANENYIVKDGRGRERGIPVPWISRIAWSMAESGERVAVVTPHVAGRDSGFYHVAMLGLRGDTVYSRRYPFRAIPVTARMRDSVTVRAVRSIEGGPPIETLRAEVGARIPPLLPPIDEVHLGRDYTLWVGLRAAQGDKMRRWAMIDPTGTLVGHVDLDRRHRILLADRGTLWVNVQAADNAEALSEGVLRLVVK